ncbi:MAG: hypothetical protein JXR25_00870 [Pontiellaceae bacterium]|nr:hypothetical protein [Pontiellaceae bacterium]MBN2783351.1 hypothetical protein [Pontiellaceae bacterium]
MNKTYISSLLVVLMAGAQVQAQDSDLELMGAPVAAAETETAAAVPVATATSVDGLIAKGKELYGEKDFNQARVNFEAALAVDPYDKEAMKMLRKTAEKIAAYEKVKLESVRSASLTDIGAAWTPDFADSLQAVNERDTNTVQPVPVEVIKMTDYLKSVQIPSLDFRDANIKDVVLFLTETCRRMDSKGKGINMILLGLDASDSMGTDEGNNITISIRDLSLFDSLQVITEMASLKFTVEANMILIMPVNYVRSVELATETFTVVPEVGEELASMAGGGDSGDTMDDLFGGGDSSSMSSDSGPTDVSSYFSIVSWPKNSKAVYYPNFRKLIVQNTKENLAAVKEIVKDLEETAIARRSSQVQIEAKFVEFAEGNLAELGFDWTVNGSGNVAGFKLAGASDFETYVPGYGYVGSVKTTYLKTDGTSATYTQDSGNILASMNSGTSYLYSSPTSGARLVEKGQSLFGGVARTADSAFDDVTAGILASMGGNPASMLFSDGTLDLQINAMEQNGTADILSCPKVTTQSGYEAVIRVTEIHRYPQDWDVETGQRTAPVVKPQDWEDFDLGVVLRVTPEVDTENNTIKLELNPEIRTFKGFDGYHVADNAYDAGTTYNEEVRGDGTELFAEMPFFETRSVQTRVTVADGSTVMMGGLVDETTETFRDQVPILGDIPYIGRLFRTEGSRSSKKNLVIFVKATQVDEMGMTRVDREMARKAAAGM